MKALARALLKVSKIIAELSTADRRLLAESVWQSYGHDINVAVSPFHDPRHDTDVAATETNVAAETASNRNHSVLSSTPVVPKDYPEELQEIRVFLRKISAPAVFDDVDYWVAIHAWLGDSRIGYLDELAKYLAWNLVQNGARKHRDLKRGFRNWLSKSEYWSEQQAQRQAVRRGR